MNIKKLLPQQDPARGGTYYWILGFILAIIGLSFFKGLWQLIFIILGIIIFVSDIKSFSSINFPTEKIPKIPNLPKLPEININPIKEFKKMFIPKDNKERKNLFLHKTSKGKKNKKSNKKQSKIKYKKSKK